ncbi:MAG: hypothetical protein Q6353_001055 [Candidatus Sigynarchaeum springense]
MASRVGEKVRRKNTFTNLAFKKKKPRRRIFTWNPEKDRSIKPFVVIARIRVQSTILGLAGLASSRVPCKSRVITCVEPDFFAR